MEKICGMSLSDDILFGKCVYFEQNTLSNYFALAKDIEVEKNELQEAIKETKNQLRKIYEDNVNTIGKANAMIFKSHETILDDEELIKKIEDIIKELKCNAEYAIFKAAEYFSNILKNVENEYIQARANGVKEIGLLLVENMHRKENNHKLSTLLAEGRNSLLKNQGLIVAAPFRCSCLPQIRSKRIYYTKWRRNVTFIYFSTIFRFGGTGRNRL